MRILITVDSYFPSYNGIQFVTSYLAEGLAQRGHSVHVITKKYQGFQDSNEVINGVEITRFEMCTKNMIHSGDKQGFLDYVLANQSKFDVMINVATHTPFTDWLLPVMDQIRIPKVLHLHSIYDFKFHKSDFDCLKSLASKILGNVRWRWYFFRYKNAFKQYNAVLQLHEKDYSYSFFKRKYGIESIILENAAENPFFEIEDVKKEKFILNVANYCKGKNQLQCVKVFENSNLSNEWKLIFVGSKSNAYYEKLKNYCETIPDQTKKDRIVLHVGLPREGVIELVKKSSIYMTTSLREAFPISLLEAMAAGVPYISSDVGIVKHLGGGLVVHTQEEFVKSLERLATDEEYRIKLGREGRLEACNKYKISKKVEQLETILYSLISRD